MVLPGLTKGGQVGGDHDRGHILYPHLIGRNGYAHAFEHIDQGLGRKGGAALVSGSIKADHQAVTNDLVGANALKGGDVLEPDGGGRPGQEQDRGQGDEGDDGLFVFHFHDP